MKERTEWGGQNESQIGGEEKRSGRLVGASETSGELAEWCRFQQKNVSILGLRKRKEWPQCYRESSWQVRQSRRFQKEKEQCRQSRVPDREGGESQGEWDPHLDEREGDQSESMKRRGWTSQWRKGVPRRRGLCRAKFSGYFELSFRKQFYLTFIP